MRKILSSLLLACAIHALFFVMTNRLLERKNSPTIPLTAISPKELAELKQRHQRPIVTIHTTETAKKPSHARYMAEHNQSVDQETKSSSRGVLTERGGSTTVDLSKFGVAINTHSETTAPGQTHDQELLDDTLVNAAATMLNTDASIYYSFYARLHDAIGQIWERNLHIFPADMQTGGFYQTTLAITLDPSGKLKNLLLIHSSGAHHFDTIALKSVQEVGLFPNPPKGLLRAQNDFEIVYNFVLNVHSGFDIRAMRGTGSPLRY